ncbi:ferredoxin [Mycobacteriaceae bacterium 1482268.1]|nr:ferredoxin [Mycobacteriaceae bacterium 1482268.1]
MGLLDRYRQTPPSMSGRLRHDIVVAIADTTVTALWTLTGATRKLNLPSDTQPLLELTVVGRQVVARDQDVVALTLAAAGGEPLPRWHPGAHLDIHLPSGKLRRYSLCGNPDDRRSYRIAVRRIVDGGGGSIEVHDGLSLGATVTTHGPRNAFPLTVPGYGSPAQRFRFIAGGIGITPILPMLAFADRFGVDWSMVYAGRSRDSLPFLGELSRFGDRIEVRTDDIDGIPTAAELLGDCPDGTTVYACGPAPMLTAIRAALAGRDDVELHFERFAEPPVVDGEEFTVTMASTGQEVVVGAEETLLTALRRSDIDVPYSCRQGFCGTCRTRVLAGAVDHRDTLLTEPERENGLMLVCISRAANGERITLDL